MSQQSDYIKEESQLAKRHIFTYLLQGAGLYVLFSVCISLFAEEVLWWTFFNTAGVAAWTMRRIATHTQQFYHKLSKSIDSKVEAPPFRFPKAAWFALLAPLLGSSLLQMLYFRAIVPVETGLLLVWVGSNLILTLIFALVGAVLMRLRLRSRERRESQKSTFEVKKKDTKWIDRVLSSVVLVFYISTLLLSSIPVQAACPKGEITEEQLIECYEPDTKIGAKGTDVKEPVEQKMHVDGTEANGGEGAIENGELEKYEGAPEQEPNLFVAAGKGLWELGKDAVNGAKEQGGKAGKYIKENWNKPGKVINDGKKAVQDMKNAFNDGQGSKVQQKKDEAGGFINGIKKKAEAYQKDFMGELKKDAGWVNKTIIKPAVKQAGDTIQHIRKHPEDILKFTNFNSMVMLVGEIYIENNYQGGAKQLNRDLAAALEDKNTYPKLAANLLGISEETQQLFREEKYLQAFSRAAGELSVEAGIELLSTVGTGGAKGAFVVAGFVADARKVAKKVDKVDDTVRIVDKVGDYERLPRRMLPDVKVPRSKYDISEDTSNFSDESLQHLFDGDAKRYSNGKISIGGYHHEGEDSIAKIKTGTKIEAHNGVYQAEVEYLGYQKNTHPQGLSTFFPKSWSRNDVIKSINETHQPRYLKEIQRNGNALYENTVNGVKINVIVNPRTNKVITSYPVWPQ